MNSEGQQIFNVASMFFEVALRASEPIPSPYSPGTVLQPLPAAIANAALACELYLKSALTDEGIAHDNKHGLDVLLAKLPGSIRDEVRGKYAALTGTKPGEFQATLTAISKAFVEWRYSFEQPRSIKMKAVIALALALHQIGKKNYGHTADQLLDERVEGALLRPLPDVTLHEGGLGTALY